MDSPAGAAAAGTSGAAAAPSAKGGSFVASSEGDVDVTSPSADWAARSATRACANARAAHPCGVCACVSSCVCVCAYACACVRACVSVQLVGLYQRSRHPPLWRVVRMPCVWARTSAYVFVRI